MSQLLKPLVVLWLCLAAVNVFALKTDASTAGEINDPYLHVAKFYYNKGNIDKALLTIEQAAFLWPVSDESDRYLLAAEILIEQKRFSEAQKAFNKVLGNKKALTLMSKVAFPLAQLHFAKGNCQKSSRLLKVSNKNTVPKMLESFYIRSNCLAANKAMTLSEFERLQSDISNYIKENKRNDDLKRESMWLAYTYYNLAIVAQNLRLDSQVTELFDVASSYSIGAPESADFVDKVKMTQAFTKYANNQYDEAFALFSQLDLNGLWLDQSLLGFGWSAYHNYKRGVALEAWRQLVHLPNRSMSVYEAMITIPFALEKAKSFSRALKAYDFAVDNYSIALNEIDQLQSSLSLNEIQQHALEYVESLESGKTIAPLHPLITNLYTREDFRNSVINVGEIAYQKEKIKQYQEELDALSDSLGWVPASSDSPELQDRSSVLLERLNNYKQGIFALRTSMLDEAMRNPKISKDIRIRYNRYIAVKAMATKYGIESERMQRLQGVILWQLYETGEYPSENLIIISKMLANQRMLQARLDSLPQSLEQMAALDRPGSKQVAMLKARIDLLDQKLAAVSVDAEQYVLDMTLSALSDYEEKIKHFQKQARIARARLREEFYQLGGQK